MNSLLKLLRFLTGYGIAVALLFYLLPVAGLLLETQYDALSSSAKFFSVIGVFAVLAIWQAATLRDRMKRTPQTR